MDIEQILINYSKELLRHNVSSKINYENISEYYYFVIDYNVENDSAVMDLVIKCDNEITENTTDGYVIIWDGMDIKPRGITKYVSMACNVNHINCECRG